MSNSEIKNLGNFETAPEFAYLWDRCVYEMLYAPDKFVDEFSSLLEKHGVTKASAILDSAAGSGFPALDMVEKGFLNIACVDVSDDQIRLFNKRAESKNLSIRSQKVSWNEIPEYFKDNKFKAIICKGSLWYAAGGWNEEYTPDRESALEAMRVALKVFYTMLETGGVLYVDKFKDSEVDHKDTVGTFQVGDKKKELMFYTHREPEKQIRRAAMIIKDIETGTEEGLPNVTYDLKENELEDLLKEAGFAVTKPNLSEEKFFAHWLAIKQ
jgi:ubiquinone/menaquinone biosynthesis C-methylase UbiE